MIWISSEAFGTVEIVGHNKVFKWERHLASRKKQNKSKGRNSMTKANDRKTHAKLTTLYAVP